MDVQGRRVKLPLGILESDVQVCLEELVDLAELRYSRKFGELEKTNTILALLARA